MNRHFPDNLPVRRNRTIVEQAQKILFFRLFDNPFQEECRSDGNLTVHRLSCPFRNLWLPFTPSAAEILVFPGIVRPNRTSFQKREAGDFKPQAGAIQRARRRGSV